MLYISLRQYEYVCAIGRHGSLSSAAQHLNVSQPALSTALTRVEAHLGYPLFIRRRGAAMALPPQGRRFIEQAEDILNKAARLETSATATQGATHVRLGCFIDLAPFHLAPALHQLRNALPDVSVTYVVDGFEGLMTGLIDDQVDIAITYDLGMDAGFVRQTLFESRPHAILSPDHPLARACQVTLSELERHPLILSNEGLSAQHVLGLFRRNGLSPTVAHRAASLEIQRSLAAHNEGIGISYASPRNTLSYDDRRLVSLPISNPDAPEAVVLARHGTGPTDATLQIAECALFECLKAP
ncbi:LysR family transcriptional regulator [Rhodobacteraceae bacterium B1Z28]|uniref:LysR family transcriptional regulator n=1 Tax=Ruegeria haliotis TaxID=2747601 RepID=A0ABX2PUP9_9RHOB|nr:LysR family transcriptional regulator [Ruegeria haliotis]NVO57096.1 LysR family transcriptional regulator [Ruegeria haliotis]